MDNLGSHSLGLSKGQSSVLPVNGDLAVHAGSAFLPSPPLLAIHLGRFGNGCTLASIAPSHLSLGDIHSTCGHLSCANCPTLTVTLTELS